jgi:hypothetical protein
LVFKKREAAFGRQLQNRIQTRGGQVHFAGVGGRGAIVFHRDRILAWRERGEREAAGRSGLGRHDGFPRLKMHFGAGDRFAGAVA